MRKVCDTKRKSGYFTSWQECTTIPRTNYAFALLWKKVRNVTLGALFLCQSNSSILHNHINVLNQLLVFHSSIRVMYNCKVALTLCLLLASSPDISGLFSIRGCFRDESWLAAGGFLITVVQAPLFLLMLALCCSWNQIIKEQRQVEQKKFKRR